MRCKVLTRLEGGNDGPAFQFLTRRPQGQPAAAGKAAEFP